MSLSINAIAALLAQLSGALGLLLATPVFLQYLGTEAFGLYGILATLQSLVFLLDLGVSTSFLRETARFRANQDREQYQAVFRLTMLFAAAGAGLLLLAAIPGSYAIAEHWLEPEALPLGVVETCLLAIFCQLACRWISGFLKAMAIGFEWIPSASSIATFANLLRYGLGAGILVWPGVSITAFFWFQALCAAVEVVLYLLLLRNTLPRPLLGPLRYHAVRSEIRMAGALSVAVILWSISSQLDRIVLSEMLPLGDFGSFILAVTISSGVLILSGPLGSILIPRLTALKARGELSALRSTYYQTLAMIVITAGAVSLTLALFMDDVFRVWLGSDRRVTAELLEVGSWYALGNLALITGSVTYYLQVALGNLRYHLIGAFASTLVLVPAILILVQIMGMRGAGLAWATVNGLMLIWALWITQKILDGASVMRWFSHVLQPFVAMTGLGLVLRHSLSFPAERLSGLCYLAAIAALLVLIGALTSPLGLQATVYIRERYRR